ncbi:unnamed protein product, partial [Didymodactylos carnosus]
DKKLLDHYPLQSSNYPFLSKSKILYNYTKTSLKQSLSLNVLQSLIQCKSYRVVTIIPSRSTSITIKVLKGQRNCIGTFL